MHSPCTPPKRPSVEVCELSPTDSSPPTSARAQATGCRGPLPSRVEDRLLTYGLLYAERKEQRRLEGEIARRQLEAEARSQAAVLRSRNTNTHVFAQPSPEEVKQRLARQKAREEALLLAEQAAWTHRPSISAASAKLAASWRRKAHVQGLSTADALMAQEQQREARIAERRRTEEQARYPHAPVISAHAKGMRMPLSAAERLYALSKEQAADEQAARALATKLETQSSSFAPRISARARSLKRKESDAGGVYSALYAQSKERAGALEARQRMAAGADTFHPQINPTSRIIAKQLKESGRERREARGAAVNGEQRAQQSPPRAMNANCRPQRQQTSSSCVVPTHLRCRGADSTVPVHQRMERWMERQNAKLLAARQQLAVERAAECTFAPRTTAYRPSNAAQTGEDPVNSLGQHHFWEREEEVLDSGADSDGAVADLSSLLVEVNAALRLARAPPAAPTAGDRTRCVDPEQPLRTVIGCRELCAGAVPVEEELSVDAEVDLISHLLHIIHQ